MNNSTANNSTVNNDAVEAVADGHVDIICVLDGCGIGAADDAYAWGTTTANTLAHTAAAVGKLHAPVMQRWGLGNLTDIAGISPTDTPEAQIARAVMHSAGCDTPSGHSELAGRVVDVAPVVYPNGFDDDLMGELSRVWKVDGILSGAVTGGLAVLDDWADEHLKSAQPIVYTSADSVLQVAAHVDVIDVAELYRMCEQAREICDDRWPVARIIARPFQGSSGAWERLGGLRRDWGLPAPADNAFDRLSTAGVTCVAVGKIGDIYTHRGFTREVHPDTFDGLMEATSIEATRLRNHGGGVVMVNFVEFDYRGHARDPHGFAGAVEVFDTWCAAVEQDCSVGDRIVVCADHGNDHVDHTREHTPMMVRRIGHPGADLGWGEMADLGASLCRWWGVPHTGLDGSSRFS